MFHRDHGAEDLASDQTFAWPPPGFRDRRQHFGRPTDPASGQPHRKSSDQVIQSLRDELDKHRQMFFDRLAPQWESNAQRVSFISFYYYNSCCCVSVRSNCDVNSPDNCGNGEKGKSSRNSVETI